MATKYPRMGITVSPELKKWFEDEAESMGLTLSGLVVVAMSQYKNQKEALDRMKEVPMIMDEIKKLQKKQAELEKQSISKAKK